MLALEQTLITGPTCLKNIFSPSEVGLGEHNLENVPGDSYSVQMGKH